MSDNANVTGAQFSLCTNDIERLKAFYAELLGAEELTRVPGEAGPFYVMLGLGPASLGLSLGLVADERGANAEPGRAVLAVFVESVDDLLPRVEPAGGKVLGPAKDMPWGHRVAHVSDPDGNVVNLTQQL
jgi:predicted enzyme related to lactoylglutathione lyase